MVCPITQGNHNNEETKNKKRRCSEETVRSWSPWSQSWGWKGVYGGKDLWKNVWYFTRWCSITLNTLLYGTGV